MGLHKLLERQLVDEFGSLDDLPAELAQFVFLISNSYYDFEDGHHKLEHALDISLDELRQANDDMHSIFMALPDLFLSIDEENTILQYKQGNESGLDIVAPSLVGSKVNKISIPSIAKALENALAKSRKDSSKVSVEVFSEINTQKRYFELRVLPLLKNKDHSLAVIRDITARKKAEEKLSNSERRLRNQYQILVELAGKKQLVEGGSENAFREIAEAAAQGLSAERVSVWLYNEDRIAIECHTLFEKSQSSHSSGSILYAKDYPAYFNALRQNRVVAANDASNDPGTYEFGPDYLKVLGISSILSAPIRGGGQPLGVISVEHVGPQREWSLEEQNFAGSLADIISIVIETDKRQAMQKALLDSEEKFRILAETSDSAIFVFEESLTYVNPAMVKATGYTEDELLKMRFIDLLDEDSRKNFDEIIAYSVMQSRKSMSQEVKIRKKSGQTCWLYVAIGMMSFIGKKMYMASAFDITDRKLVEDELRHQVFHDRLTGLPNRVLFMDRLERALQRKKRKKDYGFAVLYLDVDRFKVLNDSLSHEAGDHMLSEIGERLKGLVRAQDTVARLGGDEFILLLEDIRDVNYVLFIAERINTELSKPYAIDDNKVYMTVSMGIALGDADYKQADHIFRDADIALYRAKGQGKARYELFDEVMRNRALNLLQLETDLRHGIEREEFVLYYQPIVQLSNKQVIGFEALIRWRHPKRGLVPPHEFIPVAEESRVIISLGEWIIDEACRQLQYWRKRYPAHPIQLAVNVSSKQFSWQGFASSVQQTLINNNIEPGTLKFEMTESILMEDSSSISETLFSLKDMGIKFSLDDFGTGYSSLSYLHRYPIDCLKIDRSFVSGLEEGDKKNQIVNTIISLADNLDMEVVAEGVEQELHVAKLKSMGCKLAQGYYYSPPVPADEAEAMLDRQPTLKEVKR